MYISPLNTASQRKHKVGFDCKSLRISSNRQRHSIPLLNPHVTRTNGRYTTHKTSRQAGTARHTRINSCIFRLCQQTYHFSCIWLRAHCINGRFLLAPLSIIILSPRTPQPHAFLLKVQLYILKRHFSVCVATNCALPAGAVRSIRNTGIATKQAHRGHLLRVCLCSDGMENIFYSQQHSFLYVGNQL